MGSVFSQMVAFSWLFWPELFVCMQGLFGLSITTSTDSSHTKTQMLANLSIVGIVAQMWAHVGRWLLLVVACWWLLVDLDLAEVMMEDSKQATGSFQEPLPHRRLFVDWRPFFRFV